jgi:hypothetical protein
MFPSATRGTCISARTLPPQWHTPHHIASLCHAHIPHPPAPLPQAPPGTCAIGCCIQRGYPSRSAWALGSIAGTGSLCIQGRCTGPRQSHRSCAHSLHLLSTCAASRDTRMPPVPPKQADTRQSVADSARTFDLSKMTGTCFAPGRLDKAHQ